MTITITAFERSPDGGKGLARDTRVRWALEEVGQPYEVRLVSFRAMKEPAHLALHPFGQIPTYEEGDLGLFETGAIVFHIAERHAGLLPDDANARARAITWMFAALSTVEPPILELGTARLLEGDKSWSAQRMPLVEDRVRNRLGQLSRRLGDADWLDGAFSAGDLMMVSVLLRLKASRMLDEYPNLSAYVARGEARPAYKRAFDAQFAVNTGNRQGTVVRLECTNCVVRDWERSDRASLIRFANNRKIWRNLTDMFPHPYTEAHAEWWFGFLEKMTERTHWAIDADGQAVGGIGVILGEGIYAKSGHFGYWLGEEYWGRGIMTQAVGVVAPYVMSRFDLLRLDSPVFAWNPASMRVLEKCGFVQEGVSRASVFKDGEVVDQVLYGLVRRGG